MRLISKSYFLGRPTRANLLASVCFSFIATASIAQDVTLEANDGSVRLQGVLVEFADGLYTLQTEIGLLTIDEGSVTCTGPGCPQNQAAEPVVDLAVRLISDDGATEVVGNLIEFADNFYTVETVLGIFRIDAAGVECAGDACPEIEEVIDPRFTIYGGEDAMRDLLPELLEGYAASRGLLYDLADETGSTIRLLNASDGGIVADIGIELASSFESFAALASREADVAIVDQPLGTTGSDSQMQEYLLGFDAMVLVTHEDNPVRDLTITDLGQIWGGQAGNWVSFGGGDVPMSVHMARDETGQVSTVFNNEVLRANGLGRGDLENVAFYNSGSDVIRAVASDRTAIGVVNRVAAQDAGARMLEIRQACGLMSAPTDFDLKVDNYPLARPVLAYIGRSRAHPVASDFLAWTQENEAQLRVSDAGFSGDRLQRMKIRDMGIGLVETAAMEEFNGAQFSSMLRELRDADRLSITFRFEEGSSVLDAESVGFIQDLAGRLGANEFDGLEVLLVGFADSSGGAALNTALAQDRADAVRDILGGALSGDAGGATIRALSFGEQLPIACNDTATGRANNRRVEVWVRQAG